MKVSVCDLTTELLDAMDPMIRIEDRMEWIAGIGVDVVPALKASAWGYCRCALGGDGVPLCIWGIDLPSGNVWLVATETAERHALAIHRHLRSEFARVLALHPSPQCWSDSRNLKHHDWLRWLGFEETREAHWGVLGLPFKHFKMRSPCALTP